jgi:uncharacterized repeat protein (TIGR01451 family)
VDPASAKLEVGDPVTYTISLTNSDPLMAAAPVTVTDTLPTTITLKHAEICDWSGQYAQYGQLITTTTALTWVGGLDANVQVSLCIRGEVNATPWNSTNTAWVTWNDNSIQLKVTGGEPEAGGVYLPIIVKNHQ